MQHLNATQHIVHTWQKKTDKSGVNRLFKRQQAFSQSHVSVMRTTVHREKGPLIGMRAQTNTKARGEPQVPLPRRCFFFWRSYIASRCHPLPSSAKSTSQPSIAWIRLNVDSVKAELRVCVNFTIPCTSRSQKFPGK